MREEWGEGKLRWSEGNVSRGEVMWGEVKDKWGILDKWGEGKIRWGGNAFKVRQDEDWVGGQGEFKLWDSDFREGKMRERLSEVKEGWGDARRDDWNILLQRNSDMRWACLYKPWLQRSSLDEEFLKLGEFFCEISVFSFTESGPRLWWINLQFSFKLSLSSECLHTKLC